ncbi:unnamed protein product, partial [Rotaria sp. Silwood1]
MAYLDAPHSSYSVIQENDDGQVDSLARALLNSNLPTRELSSVQAVMTDYEELQPNLQTLAHNDSLLERIDNHSRADCETVINSVDSLRSVGNAQYLKYAVGIFFIGAAAVAMCAGVTYLAPVVSGALASLTTTFGGEPIAMIPVVMAF